MQYTSIYRAPNINIAWIMQDYFVTNDIDATIKPDVSGTSDAQECNTEGKHPCPSFVLVPEDKVVQATELLKQFKLA